MRLTELNPVFFGYGGEGVTKTDTGELIPWREGVGISFDCPCGCSYPIGIPFNPPLDGGPKAYEGVQFWERVSGDTYENLTLRPSIQRVGGCRWHGFITDGEVSTV